LITLSTTANAAAIAIAKAVFLTRFGLSAMQGVRAAAIIFFGQ
jgi:hypothetical protein